MSLILSIETATEVCSIGLSSGDMLLSLQESREAYQHSSQITLLIQKCMQEAGKTLSELSALAVSTGPGSYTALRVGTSTAKGICYALNKPLIAVDTLQSLAMASAGGPIPEKALLCPMIDARRMEVYTAMFDQRLHFMSPIQSLIVEKNSFDNYFEQNIPIHFCGNGSTKIQAVIQHDLASFSNHICSAQNLIKLAFSSFKKKNFVDLAHYTPNYFKAPNITIPRKIL